MQDTEDETILIVEDDQATRDFLADNLKADRFKVVETSTLREAVMLLERRACDLVLLDLNLAESSGFELCDSIRSADGINSAIDPGLPIIMLTGRSGEADCLRGFERGADDYLVKPFHYPELKARIHAVLRRTNQRPSEGTIRVGLLVVDPSSRMVNLKGHRVELSAKEFSLLKVLASEPTRVWTKAELLNRVWGYESNCRTRTVDSHASRLRQKLAGSSGKYVINVWGVGYRLLAETA